MWYPPANKFFGPANKVGYDQYGSTAPKLGEVKHSAEGPLGAAFTVLASEKQVSWHFTISKFGQVYQHYPADAICWHSGKPAYNRDLVGVEHEGKAGEPLTEEQVSATVELSRWLAGQWGFMEYGLQKAPGTWQFWEHNEITATDCPSSRMPWARILNMLNAPEAEPEVVNLRSLNFVAHHYSQGYALNAVPEHDKQIFEWFVREMRRL